MRMVVRLTTTLYICSHEISWPAFCFGVAANRCFCWVTVPCKIRKGDKQSDETMVLILFTLRHTGARCVLSLDTLCQK